MKKTSLLLIVLSLASTQIVKADVVQTAWGSWNTGKWNRLGEEPPVGVYPPGPERALSGTTEWVWHNASSAADPYDAGWTRGANRVVYWKKIGNQPAFREVGGWFSEPDIKGLYSSDPDNKPTFYLGMEGAPRNFPAAQGVVIGGGMATDAGIQWEPRGRNQGWTLFLRASVSVITNQGNIGSWSRWKQDKEHWKSQGQLGQVKLTHTVDIHGNAVITCTQGSQSKSFKSSLFKQLTSWIAVTSFRRSVGLTQKPEKFDSSKRKRLPEGDAAEDDELRSLVSLDGSVLKNFKFTSGYLKTLPRLDVHDEPQISRRWQGPINQTETRAGHIGSLPNGNSDKIRPPSKAGDPEDLIGPPSLPQYIVNFVSPLKAPRDPNNQFGYQTGFSDEHVVIRMGVKRTVQLVRGKRKSK